MKSLYNNPEFLQILFENSPDGIMVDDGSGNYIEVNETLCRWLGYSREEFLRLKVTDLIPAADLASNPLKLKELKKGTSISNERFLLRKDGSIMEAELTARELPGGQILIMLRDIEERKQLQALLEGRIASLTHPHHVGSTVAFEDLFDIREIQRIQDLFAGSTGVASIITRPDGTPITRSSGFCRLCDEIIRKTEKGLHNCYYSDSIIGRHNPDGPVVQPCLSGGLWDAGASITVEGKHIANWLIGQVRNETQSEESMLQYAREIGADEQAFLDAYQVVPLMSADQFKKIAESLFAIANLLSTIAFHNLQQARLINERTQSVKALHESEERFRKAFYTSPDSLNLNRMDDGMFVEVNEGFTKLCGYTEEDVRGKTSLDINIWANPEDRIRMVGLLKEYSYVTNFEANFRMKDGAIRTGLMSATILNIQGIPHILSITRDIESIKIAREELIKARNAAEESSKMKTSFINNISHEVRTPLNAIMGFAELLHEEELEEDVKQRFTRIIMNNSRQLLGIIDDVLEISRLESGRIPMKLNVFSITEMMKDIYSTMLKPVEEANLEFICEYSEEKDYVIQSDKEKLQQVISGLISNAIKFTRKGNITIGFIPGDEDVEFYVKDTGIGIEPEYHEKIFERFFQVKNTNAEHRGTGLGLSIAKGLIDLMNGTIHVESKPGAGSVFVIRIPAHWMKSESNPRPKGNHTRLNKVTVLIAEDEDDSYEYLKTILYAKVRKILRAKTGFEAVRMVELEKPDLILMDIKMPDLDGFEASRYIHKSLPNLPIIAQTAYSNEEDESKALEAGCVGFISKPIRVQELLGMISRIFEGSNEQ